MSGKREENVKRLLVASGFLALNPFQQFSNTAESDILQRGI
jgi:hypothetical protein